MLPQPLPLPPGVAIDVVDCPPLGCRWRACRGGVCTDGATQQEALSQLNLITQPDPAPSTIHRRPQLASE